MVALEGIVDRLVPPAVQCLGEVVEVTEIASRAVSRINLAVLEVGLPVQGHDGRGPDAITVDPRQGAIHIGRAFTHEKGIAGSVRDLLEGGGLAVAAIAEDASEDAAAAPVRADAREALARVEVERRIAGLCVAPVADVAGDGRRVRLAQQAPVATLREP